MFNFHNLCQTISWSDKEFDIIRSWAGILRQVAINQVSVTTSTSTNNLLVFSKDCIRSKLCTFMKNFKGLAWKMTELLQ